MSQSTICRLCLQACNDFKSLYNNNGRANELHELTLEYFHPKIVDMEAAKHLTVVCVECARHIYDFHQFQASITMAQLNLIEKLDSNELAVKRDHESIPPEYLDYQTAMATIKTEKEEDTGGDFETIEDFMAFFVAEGTISGDELSTEENFKSSASPTADVGAMHVKLKDSAGAPKLPAIDEVTTDFITKPKLEIIDVHGGDQSSEYYGDAEATNRRPPYSCTFCDSSFRQQVDIVAHMRQQHGTQSLKCNLCTNTYSTRRGLRYHVKRWNHNIPPTMESYIDHDAITKKFNCKICDGVYKTKSRLIAHLEKFHRDKVSSESVSVCQVFKCNYCPHANLWKSCMRVHIKRHHFKTSNNFDYDRATKIFTCKFCPHSSRQRRSLREHTAKEHHKDEYTSQKMEFNYDDVTKMFNCKLCNFSHKKINGLVDHTTRNHWASIPECQHKCVKCGKSFTKADVLKADQVAHAPTGTYACAFCSMKFKYTKNLLLHIEKLHIRGNDRPAENVAPSSVEGNQTDGRAVYACRVCGKTFNAYWYLHLHKRTRHSLHAKVHKCDICGIVFKTAVILRRHRQYHTKGKMYPCPFCPMKYKYSICLAQHTKKVHPHKHVDVVGNSDIE